MEFIHLVYILLIIFALYSVFAKNLKRAIVGCGLLGLWVSIAYMLYHAPDVAIAEAVISSALTTILYVVTIKNYNDISTKLPKPTLNQSVAYLIAFTSFCLVIYLTYLGTPFSESAIGIMVMESFFQHGSEVNPVAGILLNYRAFDTIFEALLLLISGVGVVHLVNSAKAKEEAIIYDDDPWHEAPDFGNLSRYYSYAEKIKEGKIVDKEAGHSVTLRHKKHPSAVLTIAFVFPILVFISISMVSDPLTPGGGFQGGAMLAATFVSHYLIMPDHPVSTKFLTSCEKFIFLIFLAVALTYILLGAKMLFPEFYWGYIVLMDILLGAKVFCGLSIVFICFSREHNKV